MPDYPLAIIIPAYKAAFLRQTLEALLRQTDQRFHVYIGDDASPEPIDRIAGPFLARHVHFHYRRFPNNLGKAQLVQHWERCLKLSKGEPWLWLLGDDDIIGRRAVEQFYKTLKQSEAACDIYRFDKSYIDETGRVISLAPPHPEHESALNFAYHLLTGKRSCTASEYIFSRKKLEEVGGFIDFPAAWGSDWCTWMAIGAGKGLCLIPDERVLFRLSPLSLSGSQQRKGEKVEAVLAYCRWLLDFFDREQPKSELPLDHGQWAALLERHFLTQIKHEHHGFPWRQWWPLAEKAAAVFEKDTSYFLVRLLLAQYVAKRNRLLQWAGPRRFP